MAKEKRENVRVSSKIKRKVKQYIGKTKQFNIGNFYDLAAEEKLIREKNSSVYFEMGAPYSIHPND